MHPPGFGLAPSDRPGCVREQLTEVLTQLVLCMPLAVTEHGE